MMFRNAARVVRAVATNQLARVAPGAYVQLTAQTGRGEADREHPEEVVRYFLSCADDYAVQLRLAGLEPADCLNGRILLEYGPGDLPGVALVLVARGASQVICVDRFPLVRLSEKNLAVLRALVDVFQGEERARLLACFADPLDLAAGFDRKRIDYVVRANGLSGLRNAVDVVLSRAVLEHVNDLAATFADMVAALRPGGLAMHMVDLRSHGLHRSNPLDFLAWSPVLWSLMYSAKGVPNRWRVDRYRAELARLPLDVLTLAATKAASAPDVEQVRPVLAPMFRHLTDEDLSCLGFWLLCRRRQG